MMMVRKAHWQAMAVLAILGALGCKSSFNVGTYGSLGTGGSGGWAGTGGMRVMLHDTNNYGYRGWVEIPAVKVTPKSDLLFRWGGLTKDMLGHPLDPKKDINTVIVFMWHLSAPMLAGKMRTDTLLQVDLKTLPIRFETDGTTTEAYLSQFQSMDPGVTFEVAKAFLDPVYYPPEDYTYTVTVATGTDTREYCGNRMIQAFQLDDSESNTIIDFTEKSTTLVSNVYFDELTPIQIPVGFADVVLDTTNVSLNAITGVFDGFIEAFVGHYSLSPAELAQRFTDLELLATELYKGETLDNRTIDLSTLRTDQGKGFSGIDASGTWLVALRKTGCHNPLPLYLSILKPL